MQGNIPKWEHCSPEKVSPLQQDVLQELVNIGMGRAAGALNQMTRCHVSLESPAVRVVRLASLARHARQFQGWDLDIVLLRFSGEFSGMSCLLFNRDSGSYLVRLMFGGVSAPDDLDLFREDALREVGNIVLIWVMGAIGNAIHKHLDYHPLEYPDSLAPLVPLGDDSGMALLIKATFRLEDAVIQGDILMIFNGEDCSVLLQAVDDLTKSIK